MSSAATPTTPESFSENRLIICEGIDDQRFFSAFIKNRLITGLQVIRYAEGISGFEKRLNEIEVQIVVKKIKSILLVIDSDNDPRANFKLVAKQIEKTGKYGVPTAFKRRSKKVNRPSIAILSIPDGNNGNIETILLDLFLSNPRYKNLSKCLERFTKCSDAKHWDIGKQSKMKLHCFIAATCKNSPECRVADMWQEDKDFRHLLKDAKFDGLEKFLKKFATW